MKDFYKNKLGVLLHKDWGPTVEEAEKNYSREMRRRWTKIMDDFKRGFVDAVIKDSKILKEKPHE